MFDVELRLQPARDRRLQLLELRPRSLGDPLEEVIGALDPDDLLGLWSGAEHLLQHALRRKLVVVSADEELRNRALRQEVVGVVPVLRLHWQAQAEDSVDAGIVAA